MVPNSALELVNLLLLVSTLNGWSSFFKALCFTLSEIYHELLVPLVSKREPFFCSESHVQFQVPRQEAGGQGSLEG